MSRSWSDLSYIADGTLQGTGPGSPDALVVRVFCEHVRTVVEQLLQCPHCDALGAELAHLEQDDLPFMGAQTERIRVIAAVCKACGEPRFHWGIRWTAEKVPSYSARVYSVGRKVYVRLRSGGTICLGEFEEDVG